MLTHEHITPHSPWFNWLIDATIGGLSLSEIAQRSRLSAADIAEWSSHSAVAPVLANVRAFMTFHQECLEYHHRHQAANGLIKALNSPNLETVRKAATLLWKGAPRASRKRSDGAGERKFAVRAQPEASSPTVREGSTHGVSDAEGAQCASTGSGLTGARSVSDGSSSVSAGSPASQPQRGDTASPDGIAAALSSSPSDGGGSSASASVPASSTLDSSSSDPQRARAASEAAVQTALRAARRVRQAAARHQTSEPRAPAPESDRPAASVFSAAGTTAARAA